MACIVLKYNSFEEGLQLEYWELGHKIKNNETTPYENHEKEHQICHSYLFRDTLSCFGLVLAMILGKDDYVL